MKSSQLLRTPGDVFKWIGWMTGLVLVVTVKHYYSHATAEQLDWILRPTAVAVKWLSGLHFEREANGGYINYVHRAAIAPSCAGLNFWICIYAVTMWAGLKRLPAGSAVLAGCLLSPLVATVVTIAANAVRIVVCVHLYAWEGYTAVITPDRVHRTAGVLLYFLFLWGWHHLLTSRASSTSKNRWHGVAPWLWYLAITVAIPGLRQLARPATGTAVEHFITVIAVSGLACLLATFGRHWFRLTFERDLPHAA